MKTNLRTDYPDEAHLVRDHNDKTKRPPSWEATWWRLYPNEDHTDEEHPDADHLVRDHPDDRPPWWRAPWWRPPGKRPHWLRPPWEISLMRDHPDEDHPEDRPSWWEATLMKTTLRTDPTDDRPPWWRPPWGQTQLMTGHPEDRLHWWEATLMKITLQTDYIEERPPLLRCLSSLSFYKSMSPLLLKHFLWILICPCKWTCDKEPLSLKSTFAWLERVLKQGFCMLHLLIWTKPVNLISVIRKMLKTFQYVISWRSPRSPICTPYKYIST